MLFFFLPIAKTAAIIYGSLHSDRTPTKIRIISGDFVAGLLHFINKMLNLDT